MNSFRCRTLAVLQLKPPTIFSTLQAQGSGGVSQGSPRQLVLTSAALIERHSDSYEVAEWRQLALIAALVRFINQPQWLAIEWADGARPTMYITPARDALLAALLDAAQVYYPPGVSMVF